MKIKQDIRLLCNHLHDIELKLASHHWDLSEKYATLINSPESVQAMAKHLNRRQGIDVKEVIGKIYTASEKAREAYEYFHSVLNDPDIVDYPKEGI